MPARVAQPRPSKGQTGLGDAAAGAGEGTGTLRYAPLHDAEAEAKFPWAAAGNRGFQQRPVET